MKKRVPPFKIASTAISCAVGFYLVTFVYCFDIFSLPTRSWDGWLGPLVRSDSQALDIGAWETNAPDRSLYRAFAPLCYLWLRVQGLSPGE
jgi:hypothetical protein